jgi:hypothetical protein
MKRDSGAAIKGYCQSPKKTAVALTDTRTFALRVCFGSPLLAIVATFHGTWISVAIGHEPTSTHKPFVLSRYPTRPFTAFANAS